MISDELFELAQLEFSKGNNWIVYDRHEYFLDANNVFFHASSQEAHELCERSLDEEKEFRVFHADSVIDLLRRLPYEQIDFEKTNDLLTKNLNPMIEKNLDYLKSNLRNHGFGETLNSELEAQLQKGVAEFTLSHKVEVNKHEMEATLYFKKSDTSDLYFFNKYDTRLQTEKNETLAQTFYINNGWGVTMKEAYNLLNGRAVHKELTNKENEKYQAWIQLDFSSKDKNGNYERKQYHQNYGYDLKEALSFYPIKEMKKDDDAKDLLRSLERGNVQMVTVQVPGSKDVRVFIEANPQYKSINLYDNKMTRLGQEQRESLMVMPTKDKSKQQEMVNGEQAQGKEKNRGEKKDNHQQQDLAGEGKDGKKQGKSRKNDRMNGEENGLVQKKRTSKGKGMSV